MNLTSIMLKKIPKIIKEQDNDIFVCGECGSENVTESMQVYVNSTRRIDDDNKGWNWIGIVDIDSADDTAGECYCHGWETYSYLCHEDEFGEDK